MGDLEISASSIIYNAFILLLEIKNNTIELINKYGDIYDNEIKLTLCLINNNHFMVIYEKSHLNYKYNNKENNNKIKNNEINLTNKNIILKYPIFNNFYSYDDIFNYLETKKKNCKGLYPEYINIKIDYKQRKI